MKQTIPAVTITVCDRCGARSDEKRDPFYHNHATVTVVVSGVDGFGNGAGHTYSLDLCGKCCTAFDAWRAEGK